MIRVYCDICDKEIDVDKEMGLILQLHAMNSAGEERQLLHGEFRKLHLCEDCAHNFIKNMEGGEDETETD